MKCASLLLAALVAIAFATTASARTLHYQVTVTVTGPGHVTAPAPDPTSGSIDCPTQCSALIKQGTTLTLTATPGSGATFGGWGGNCASAGTGSTCALTMTGQGSNGSMSVTAGFGAAPPPAPRFRLDVTKVGTGRGFVGGGGIDCGHVCAKTLVLGTKVTLIAVTTGNSVFLGWGAPCSGSGRCLITVHRGTDVSATFVDPHRPYVETLPGSVVRGKATLLRFRAWDRTGRSRELLTVTSGRTTLAHANVPMKRVSFRLVSALRWLAPRAAPRGVARYCAVAIDAAGKRSPKACSPFAIH